MTSNQLRFDCRQRGDGGVLVIVPRIAGTPLTELIDRLEIAAGMKPAGDAYGGLIPLMAHITATADLVIWDSFEQPHREARDYRDFGPFRFDRHPYDDALRALDAAIGSDET